MNGEKSTISCIDVYEDGSLHWHEDGALLDTCEDCGNAITAAWHAPDLVWENYRVGADFLCWSCFVARLR